MHLLRHEVHHDIALLPSERAVSRFDIIAAVAFLSFDRFDFVQCPIEKCPGKLVYSDEMINSHAWTTKL